MSIYVKFNFIGSFMAILKKLKFVKFFEVTIENYK